MSKPTKKLHLSDITEWPLPLSLKYHTLSLMEGADLFYYIF